MGRLVAVGGLHIPSAQVGRLERALDALCAECGFPQGDEFKWSPGRELWMRDNLVDKARESFFLRALGLASVAGATALVVIEDCYKGRAHAKAASPEEDVVVLFLERAHIHLTGTSTEAMLLTDRPSGSRQDEVKFLSTCLTTMRFGTDFVLPDRLTLAVATQSKLVRLLQLADVVVSCTLAYVGGETAHSPAIFNGAILPILRGGGGIGLKIQPDGRYANLYYWLLGDHILRRRNRFVELPDRGRAYFASPDVP